jgi:hypothetical protein
MVSKILCGLNLSLQKSMFKMAMKKNARVNLGLLLIPSKCGWNSGWIQYTLVA